MKYLLFTIILSVCLTVGLADYGCPMEDVDFQGNSVEVIEGVESWQDCGKRCCTQIPESSGWHTNLTANVLL